MTELDVFEARFAEAYRRYLEEAPVGVDAAEVARVAVARRSHGWQLGRWAPGATPAAAWLVLLAALLLAAMVGAAVVGRALQPEPASDLPAGLAGTWTSQDVERGTLPAAGGRPMTQDTLSLTLSADGCVIGQVCGTLTVVDPTPCDYDFVLRSATAAAAVFELSEGTSFACGWSSWPTTVRQVSLVDDDYVKVDLVGEDSEVIPYRAVFLFGPDSSTLRLPDPYVGSWNPPGYGPGWVPPTSGAEPLSLSLERCPLGQPCGSLHVVGSYCDYLLWSRSWTSAGVVLDVGDLMGPGCPAAEWTGATLRLSRVEGRLSVSRDAAGGPQLVTILDPAD